VLKNEVLQDLLKETEELVLLELDEAKALQERVKKAIIQVFGIDSKYIEAVGNITFIANGKWSSENKGLVQYGFHNALKRIVKLIKEMIAEL
jgi:hypothetical protein